MGFARRRDRCRGRRRTNAGSRGSGAAEPKAENGVRHPIRTAEHAVEHLRHVADEGESAATPAILAGGVLTLLVPFVSILIAVGLIISYVVLPGGGSSAAPARGTTHAGDSSSKNTSGSASAGQAVFASNCSTCHGATGHGGNGGPDLTAIPSAQNRQRVIRQVTKGGGSMPSFKGTLSDQQIRDVAAYVTTKINR
jgi:cytochrome c553